MFQTCVPRTTARLPPISAADRKAERIQAAMALAARLGRVNRGTTAEIVTPSKGAVSASIRVGVASARMIVPAEPFSYGVVPAFDRMPDDIADAVLVAPVLPDLEGKDKPRRIWMSEIKSAVCIEAGISPLEIVSNRRDREVVRPRQVAMWFCHNLTPSSFPEIGRCFGRRDHTTVIHAVNMIKKLLPIDKYVGSLVDRVCDRLDA